MDLTTTTYRVVRTVNGGREVTVARDLATLEEAAQALVHLEDVMRNVRGDADFCIVPE